MKTIFDGRIIISTNETEDNNIIATIDYEDIRIESTKTNREYAAIAEVITEFKKHIIQKSKEIK